MNFQDRLKKEREKLNLSQEQLADTIYVSRQSVSKWETGKNYPSIEVLIQLSNLFSISLDELLKGDADLKDKIIKDGKELAYPKTVLFLKLVFLLFALLFILRFVILILNITTSVDTSFFDGYTKTIWQYAPIFSMIFIGFIADRLEKKYKKY